MHGVCDVTIVRGKVVWRDNTLHTEKAWGRYVNCPPNGDFAYGAIRQRTKVNPHALNDG